MDYDKIQWLISNGGEERAYTLLMEGMRQNDTDDRALHLFGMLQANASNFGMAALAYKRCTELAPKNQAAWCNLGMALEGMQKTGEARAVFERAWGLNHTAIIANNIALTYLQQGNAKQALKWIEQAEKLDPSLSNVSISRGMYELSKGNWSDGFAGLSRSVGGKFRAGEGYDLPLWDGTDAPAHVILFGEQGIGDEIMYASLLSHVRRVCPNVVFTMDCDVRVQNLFRRSFNQIGIEVFGTRRKAKPWFSSVYTHQLPIGELARYFAKSPKDVAARAAAFLIPDADMVRMYDALMSGWNKTVRTDRKRIGFCWKAGTHLTGRFKRQIPLSALAPLVMRLHGAGHLIVSLEYDIESAREIQTANLPIQYFHHATGAGCDYDHTAAFIANLDMVVGVDTTAHHAAGALGVPNIVLVHAPPMWNFADYQGDKLCWYENTRLFRQSEEVDGIATNLEQAQARWHSTIDRFLDNGLLEAITHA